MVTKEWTFVKVFRYRTARSYGPAVDRDSELGRYLEGLVPERLRDNHIVAQFEDAIHDDVYLFIHDFVIEIGKEVIVEDW